VRRRTCEASPDSEIQSSETDGQTESDGKTDKQTDRQTNKHADNIHVRCVGDVDVLCGVSC